MSRNIGSFGARLTRDQTVADGVWTKVAFNEVSWDTTEGFDIDTGGYTVGRAGKLHFFYRRAALGAGRAKPVRRPFTL
jgi:hypothetical protein